MKLIKTKCAICGSEDDYHVLYGMDLDIGDINRDTFSARRLPDGAHYRIVRCNKDGLVRSDPILEHDSTMALYRESRFTYAADAENLAATYMEALEPVLSTCAKEAKILEFGCGNGFLLKALYDSGYRNIFGVEPSIDAVGRADKAISNKIFAEAAGPDTFRSGTFDFIFFFQAFDHMQDPNGFLESCRNLLAPNGSILAFNHDIKSIQARLLKDASPIIDIEHSYLYDKDTIRMIFEKHLFRVVSVYSPPNIVSLRHLIRYLPMPKGLKMLLLGLKSSHFNAILNMKMKIKLGNLCIIAKR